MENTIFEGEYSFKTSHKVLYNYITSPGGLQQWYADHVSLQDGHYIFNFDGIDHKAEIVSKKVNKAVKFIFKDDFEGNYLEFKLINSDLDGTTYLNVVDCSKIDSEDDARQVWNNLIDDLKDIVGG